MTPLGTLIRRQISAAGPMTVADYMAMCLTHPRLGYYMNRDPFGRGGDFVTAPEVSQMFGELIGLWAAAVWQAMGKPVPVRLVEMGPGRGTLMVDLLRAVAGVPGFSEALDLHLLEASPRLRAAQAERLDREATWHDGLDSLPEGPTIAVANEFFDALPIRQLVRTDVGWQERVVLADGDGGLAFGLRPGTSALAATLPVAVRETAADGAIAEICPAGLSVAADLARRLAEQGGAALVIDYGHPASAVGETLQAVRAHRFVPVLSTPGEADLTAHVDFAALAAVAAESGASVRPLATQSAFLRSLGIELRAQQLQAKSTPSQARTVAAGLERLIDPSQMGTLFKVLAMSSPDLTVLPGFDPEPQWPNT